jgi:hypothetical protein
LLDSERIYRGALADAMRASLRFRPRDQVRKDLRDRYQTSFPAIRDVGDMQVDDDREADVLRLRLHFALPDFWQKRETKDEGVVPYQAEIAAHAIDVALPRPTTGGRTAPLGLPYPLRVRYEARLALPFELNMTPESAREEVPALQFSFASAYETRKVIYSYEVDTRAPEVALGDLDAYVAAVDKARAALTRSLLYRTPAPDRPNWLYIGIVGVCAPLLVWGSRAAFRYNPAPRASREGDPRYAGVRGWLNLLAISLMLTPLVLLYRAWTDAQAVLPTSRLARAKPALSAIVLLEMLADLGLAAYCVSNLLALLARRRSFPLHFRTLAAASVVVQVFELAALHGFSPESELTSGVTALLRSVVYAVVWTAYLHGSKRVAATFVE